MDDLEIGLTYNGKELKFPLKLVKYGYSYRIAVIIDEVPVTFEPDEEGGYRVIAENGDLGIEIPLLAAIAEKLQSLRE